jgi:hypothetical protein
VTAAEPTVAKKKAAYVDRRPLTALLRAYERLQGGWLGRLVDQLVHP